MGNRGFSCAFWDGSRICKMRLGKFCAVFVFVLLFTFDGFAQNAVLNSCYVVHRDKDMEGKKQGMRFHLNLSVNGKKDQKVWCIIEMAYYEGEDMYYFTHPKGSFEYNGHLAVYKQLTATYENSVWKDLQLFLPYQEFRNSIGELEEWRKGITYCVKVIDTDGKVLFQEWQDSKRIGYYQHIYPLQTCSRCNGRGRCWSCKGLGKVGHGAYKITCSICGGSGYCNVCNGTGKSKYDWQNDTFYSYDVKVNNMNPSSSGNSTPIYYDNTPASSGGNYTKPDNTCPSCNGTGKCSNCGGRGERRNQYSGEMEDCYICKGRGICTYCSGRGWR